MLEAFLVCSGAVFDLGNWTSLFDRADVALRFSVGLGLSWMLVTPFGNGG